MLMSKHLKTLLKILSDGNYHSGTVMGKKLNLTRSAIWKIINSAKKYGITIDAKTNLGYKIPNGLELLDKKNIYQNITSKYRFDIDDILIFNTIPSTNTYLTELLKTKKSISRDYYICLAEQQTAGKGRLGRKWFSPFAQNIYLSLLWQRFSITHELFANLSLVIAVAIVETLEEYGIKNNLSIKWPNDVLWQNRKLAGVLIELPGEIHRFCSAVIGIGLNVNMSKNNSWCGVAEIINTIPKRNKLVSLLINHILSTITIYKNCGFKSFIKKWQKYDATYGKQVVIITPQQKIFGTGFGINNKGSFLLKDRTNKIISFSTGEISLRFNYN
jgi:BirA family biotin operon repressor/biotin-[acetyl-CoA-carboxylase] ligase